MAMQSAPPIHRDGRETLAARTVLRPLRPSQDASTRGYGAIGVARGFRGFRGFRGLRGLRELRELRVLRVLAGRTKAACVHEARSMRHRHRPFVANRSRRTTNDSRSRHARNSSLAHQPAEGPTPTQAETPNRDLPAARRIHPSRYPVRPALHALLSCVSAAYASGIGRTCPSRLEADRKAHRPPHRKVYRKAQ